MVKVPGTARWPDGFRFHVVREGVRLNHLQRTQALSVRKAVRHQAPPTAGTSGGTKLPLTMVSCFYLVAKPDRNLSLDSEAISV